MDVLGAGPATHTMGQSNGAAPLKAPPQHLSRVLGLWDVVFYGMVLISPMAAVPLFGVAQKLSHGFAVTCILIAMGAMAITAVSYGRMATLYPSAGSAYTYIDRGLNPHLGFLVGWAMLLDYLDQPILNGIYVALIIQRLLPAVPYVILAAACVAFVTYLNLRSIRATARANEVMLAIMTAVIGVFIILAIRYLFKSQGIERAVLLAAILRPGTRFRFQAIATGTSLAALTYIGFDGVTLLAEEVKNPKRNILLAGVDGLRFHGNFQRPADLSSAAGLARLQDLPAPRNSLYGCRQAGRPHGVVQRHGYGPRRVESRLRAHRTTGGHTAPIQHGAR